MRENHKHNGRVDRQPIVKVLLLLLACHLSLTPSSAGNGGGIGALVRKLGTFIDSMSVSSVDRRYIDAPEKPWQLILRGNINQTDLKINSMTDVSGIIEDARGKLNWEPHIKTKPSTYLGVWAGYRGYGLGYSLNVGGDDGSYLTFGAMGGSFGFNFRLHRFETDDAAIRFHGDIDGNHFDETMSGKLDAPINVRSLFIDGYYLFNGRYCSYAAAYDQSVIQKRSAGSLIAGAMYYYANLDFSQHRNAYFIHIMDSIGNVRQWQAGIGAGYIYNLVPCRGLLISAQVMPILAFYDRVKVKRYGNNMSDYSDQLSDIENRFAEEQITEEQYDQESDKLLDQFRVWETSETTNNGRVRLNFDARLSVTYQFDRYFINAYGQFCNFPYSQENTSGRLNDWYINASVGIRL